MGSGAALAENMPQYDVLFVGAGFGSISTLWRGFNCHILERGPRSGGVWYWNAYPGARVDSDAPLYQMFDKGIWSDFDFQERYPARDELCRYFDHIDSKIHFSDHTEYNKDVTGATWVEEKHMWTVDCADGSSYTARWFIPAIGFAAKSYVPNFRGMDKFKGVMHHTAHWPQEGVDLKGKRIAVVGTGASGVQVTQEAAKDSKQFTLYQRTPNLALPMQQKPASREVTDRQKAEGHYDDQFTMALSTTCGFNFDARKEDTMSVSPEERRRHYEKCYEEGGFRFWLANFQDVSINEEANLEAYKFWRDKARARIKDPKKRDIMAPMVPPHPWGTKRPSLEQHYFECFDDDHVDVVDISEDPIIEFTERGIVTKSGEREFDVIVLATGFDAVTGSLAQLAIKSRNGETIRQHWEGGLRTSLGIAIHSFPNMFFLYGPQAPTAFSNGPSLVQCQAIWLDKFFKMIKEQHLIEVDAKKEVEEDWAKRCHDEWYSTLFPRAKSWYQGSNIPGKKVEPNNFIGGFPKYTAALNGSLEEGLKGWNVVTA